MEKLNYNGIKITLEEQKALIEICKENNSKQIADFMNLTEFRVAAIKENLRKKIKCNSVIGLVLFAIKNKIYLL